MFAWPLRLKVTVWVVFVGAVGLLVFGGVIGVSLFRAKLATVDHALFEQTEDFFGSLRRRGGSVNWSDEAEVREVFTSVRSLFAIEVEMPVGHAVYRSRMLGQESIPPGINGVPVTMTVGGKQARVLQTEHHGVVVRIAADLGPTLEVERSLILAFATVLPITILVMAIGGNVLARKALKPVDELAAAADRVTAQRLDERLPEPTTNDEIGRLTNVLNAMMDRIRTGFEQARRFSADASHELKTPLTIIRGEIEGALRMGELPPPVEKTMLNLQEETGRLIYLVEGLLLLSQADAGKLQLDFERIDFGELVAEIAEDAEILAAPRNIAVEARVGGSVFVDGEPDFLRQIVLNLFDNAVKYNVADGTVRAVLSQNDGVISFTISNTGPTIADADRDRIFRRFHRADRSRDRRTGGQGLGLSISLEVARAHGGDIVLAHPVDGMTTFTLTLPAAKA